MSTAKPYQTVYKFKNVHLKNHKPKTPCFFTQGDHRKTSKVMKVFRVKRTTVTSTAKDTVMAHSIRYLLVRHGDHH